MKNKIMLLGGSHSQVPAILEAKRRGLHTILADYYNNVPGIEYADEYHNVSTTDLDAILELAVEKDIDYILGYMSDPASETVAYVSDKLGLPGNSLESVKLLTQKEKFRQFQSENGFHTPKFMSLAGDEINHADIGDFRLPAIVKPVDSSDSKGVCVVNKSADFKKAAELALSYSRSNRIIIEDMVDCEIANFHGDAFIVDGEMKFCLLGDNLFFSKSHPFKPSSEIYPSRKSAELIRTVENEVSRLIKLSGFKNGPVNIEVRVNSENEIYVMEIGPRSGGGDTPQAIYHSVGFDMLKATFDWLLNQPIQIELHNPKPTVSFILHSNQPGHLDKIAFNSEISRYVKEIHMYAKPGDEVKPFHKPGSNIGVVILKFDDFNEFDNIYGDLYQAMSNSITLK